MTRLFGHLLLFNIFNISLKVKVTPDLKKTLYLLVSFDNHVVFMSPTRDVLRPTAFLRELQFVALDTALLETSGHLIFPPKLSGDSLFASSDREVAVNTHLQKSLIIMLLNFFWVFFQTISDCANMKFPGNSYFLAFFLGAIWPILCSV